VLALVDFLLALGVGSLELLDVDEGAAAEFFEFLFGVLEGWGC